MARLAASYAGKSIDRTGGHGKRLAKAASAQPDRNRGGLPPQRARSQGRRAGAGDQALGQELEQAVSGADPTEVPALCDALDDPGERPYSAAARERFALLAAELRMLRGHVGEPLLELVRRIIETCGIDLELAASVSEAARARRDNLDIFVKAVADFQAIDGSVSLTSLLAWLQAEDELGNGLDAATPSEADSVKLLTVHRAKGLEWDVVFLVGTCRDKFPHTRSRGLWPRRLEMLPTPLRGDERDLPQLRGHDAEALKRLETDTKEHEATEELRLGYVAFTRARHRLVVSSYVWTEGRKGGLGPSPYQVVVRDFLALADVAPLAWRECPDRSEVNPLLQAEVPEHPWPVTEHTAEALRRLEAAELVAEAVDELESGRGGAWDQQADLVERSVLDTWDDELERLLAEARRERSPEVEVPLATYTGWNNFRPESGPMDVLSSMQGSYIPFALTIADRQRTSDPRPAIDERYRSREQYVGLVSQAALRLIDDGYLLPQDLAPILGRASEHWDYLMEAGTTQP